MLHFAPSVNIMKQEAADKIKKRTEQWLLEALLRLMNKHHYNDITVSMICSEADLTRQSFYRYFKDKDSLLVRYMRTVFRELYEQINNAENCTLADLLVIYFSFWRQKKELVQILDDHGLLTNSIDSNKRFLEKCFTKLNISIGEQEVFLQFFAGGLCSCVQEWFERGMSTNETELVEKMMSFLDIEQNPHLVVKASRI